MWLGSYAISKVQSRNCSVTECSQEKVITLSKIVADTAFNLVPNPSSAVRQDITFQLLTFYTKWHSVRLDSFLYKFGVTSQLTSCMSYLKLASTLALAR